VAEDLVVAGVGCVHCCVYAQVNDAGEEQHRWLQAAAGCLQVVGICYGSTPGNKQVHNANKM
jgi:hypothetical protein